MRMRCSALGLFACLLLLPSTSLAEDSGPPSFLSYGFNGLWTGAPIGLAVGYLSTGPDYHSNEWRKLVLGAGIGALAGLGVGITLAVVDVGSEARPAYGEAILRDTGYGTLLGAVAGGVVGALVWVDNGTSKAVVEGLSIGALIGAGAGIAIGIVEGASAAKHARAAEPPSANAVHVQFAMNAALPMPGQRAPTLVPTLFGTF